MTPAAFLALITSIAKAVPIVDKWIEELVAAYVVQRKNWIKKENHDAIKKSFETDDQRPIEETMGYDHAGLPTGTPGAVIVDSLPGVRK
jgi:hypothetical protein